MNYTSDKLTKNLVRSLGPGRHSDGGGLYLVVDPSGARRWIVRVTRLCCTYQLKNGFPLSPDGFREGDAKSGVAVQDRDAHLDLGDLSVKVSRHQALTE